MDGAGDEFFAGAAFAMDQNRARRGGDGANRLLELLHGGAGANDVVERVAGGGVAAQRKVLFAEIEFFDGAIDGQLDLVDQAGTLANVVGRASRFYGFHGSRIVIDRSDQDDGGVGRDPMGVAEHFNAIDGGHFDVGDDDVVEGPVDLVFRHLPGLNRLDAVSLAA